MMKKGRGTHLGDGRILRNRNFLFSLRRFDGYHDYRFSGSNNFICFIILRITEQYKFWVSCCAVTILTIAVVRCEVLLALSILGHGKDLFFSANGNLVLPGSYKIPWMASIEDFRTLSSITIPGTHDTMALYGGPEAECQALALRDQLRAGIRFLDFKVFGLFDTLYVMNGVMYQRSTFKQVLDTVKAFLSEFKTEAVLIRVQPESFEKKTVNEMVKKLIGNDQHVWLTSGMPNMGQVRGKIVFLQRSTFTLGIPLVETEGKSKVSNVKDKDNILIKQLNQAMEGFGGDNAVVTYTSGTGFGTFWGMFLTPKGVAEKPEFSPYVDPALASLHFSSDKRNRAMHIMVGLINIGLGVILLNSGSGSGWQMDETLFPVWMGILFIVFGIMCILSEKFPSPCLVSISVILNMAGVAFAVTAIVLYSINLANVDFWWLCEHDDYEYRNRRVAPLTQSPEESLIQEKCWRGQELTLMLVRSINAVLIVLSALELCVTISSVVLGIKALSSRKREDSEVSISVILNMAGVAFAVTAIVLYSINLANVDFWWLCEHDDYEYRNRRVAPLTQSPEESLIQEKCWRGQELTLMLVRSINAVLIVLSALELCVTISSVVLGIKALSSRKREDSELGFTVFMNIAGAILAIAGIMLYTIDLRDASVLSMCDQSTNSVDPYDDKCSDMALFAHISE
ncbi:hypothetical protein F2P81_002594 [Scophthalmus maximus]|uniref:Phosphatidylinositol-specific phospholipase C X domain-containing protein n=1 Tax=Scophthalmus maximus TaxID=52904 RepID=A0A6A4TLC5_SCOMX|nr:hypothetical protein F2P81_002594 [Scophthalmus maximus]